MKKAQMFLLTFVFLSGLVAAVAGLLSQYSQIDLSAPYLTSDAFLMKSVKSSFESALVENCTKANQNLQELKSWIDRHAFYPIQTDWSLNCSSWNWTAPWSAPLKSNFDVTSPGRESEANFDLRQCYDSDGGDNLAVIGYVKAARDPWIASCFGGGPFPQGQNNFCDMYLDYPISGNTAIANVTIITLIIGNCSTIPNTMNIMAPCWCSNQSAPDYKCSVYFPGGMGLGNCSTFDAKKEVPGDCMIVVNYNSTPVKYFFDTELEPSIGDIIPFCDAMLSSSLQTGMFNDFGPIGVPMVGTISIEWTCGPEGLAYGLVHKG